jgi:hypothetical protein
MFRQTPLTQPNLVTTQMAPGVPLLRHCRALSTTSGHPLQLAPGPPLGKPGLPLGERLLWTTATDAHAAIPSMLRRECSAMSAPALEVEIKRDKTGLKRIDAGVLADHHAPPDEALDCGRHGDPV